jgi:hypothetical protein
MVLISVRRHSTAGRIMSMKNSNDTIGKRTDDPPACSAVPQPTEPPRAPVLINITEKFQIRNFTTVCPVEVALIHAYEQTD